MSPLRLNCAPDRRAQAGTCDKSGSGGRVPEGRPSTRPGRRSLHARRLIAGRAAGTLLRSGARARASSGGRLRGRFLRRGLLHGGFLFFHVGDSIPAPATRSISGLPTVPTIVQVKAFERGLRRRNPFRGRHRPGSGPLGLPSRVMTPRWKRPAIREPCRPPPSLLNAGVAGDHAPRARFGDRREGHPARAGRPAPPPCPSPSPWPGWRRP
jgi:hypothetical protein